MTYRLPADLQPGDQIIRINGTVGVVESVKWLGLRGGFEVLLADGTTEPVHGTKVRVPEEGDTP